MNQHDRLGRVEALSLDEGRRRAMQKLITGGIGDCGQLQQRKQVGQPRPLAGSELCLPLLNGGAEWLGNLALDSDRNELVFRTGQHPDVVL